MDTILAALKAGDWMGALAGIRAHHGDIDPDDAARVMKRLDQGKFNSGLPRKRLAILAGYTAEPLVPLLRWQALQRGICLEVFCTAYGLYEAAVVQRDADLAAFKPDLCYLFVGPEHLSNVNPQAECSRWIGLAHAAHGWLGCDVILNNFPAPTLRAHGHFESKAENSATRLTAELNLALGKSAPAWLHLLDVAALSARHGSNQWRDEKLHALSKVPIAHAHWATFTANLAAVAASAFGCSRKCLVLDLDNTLWGGVIGDDGMDGIALASDGGIGEGFHGFQKYVKALKERGVILAVCSKNDLPVAQQPFKEHPDMVLKLEDISFFCANWNRKDQNIALIAKTLNIGLDSLVFIDDNPAEREIVRQSLPMVAVPEMPDDASEYARTLDSAAYFETLSVTDEDRRRTELYRSMAESTEAAQAFGNYEDYLASLNMRTVIAPVDALNLARVHQLINKTNQFNLTTRRYSESEVQALLTDKNVTTRFVRLSDKFADHGLISVLIARRQGADMEIETWLMSCRVLKRGVESQLLADLISAAKKAGARRLIGRYVPTAKNGMVAAHYQEMGFTLVEKAADGASVWELRLDIATNVAS